MGKTSLLLCSILAAGVLTLVFQPIALAQEPSADRVNHIVAAVLTAHGGKEAVAGVQSVLARGTISDFFKKAQGEYARYYARPQKLRIEIKADREGEVRILDGNRGWRGSLSTLVEVQGAPLQAMAYQFAYLDLPMGFADGTYSVTYEGKKEHRGRTLNLLVVEAKGGQRIRVYTDPESNIIVRAAADFSMGMGSSELSTEYEDFRPVGKVLFPFRLVNYAGEKKLSVISLSEIMINPAVPGNIFGPTSTNQEGDGTRQATP